MITLDTNIYVSAFKFGRKPMDLLDMAARGNLVIAISEPILTEALRVLHYKFNLSPVELLRVKTLIEACTSAVSLVNAQESTPKGGRSFIPRVNMIENA